MTSTAEVLLTNVEQREKDFKVLQIRRVGSVPLLIILAVLGTCHIPYPCGLLFTPDDNVSENCLFREMKRLAQGQN